MRVIDSNDEHGFSLLELSISLTIIGFILGMVLIFGKSTIESSKIVQTLAIIDDLSKASVQFKEQYKSLPGDMLVSSTSPEIADLPNACKSGGAKAGDGNNSINKNESACVIEHLYHAGLVKSDGTDISTGLLSINSPFGAVRVISRADSKGATLYALNRNISSLIELDNIPCEVAKEIDRKADNDKISSDITGGNIKALNAAAVTVIDPDTGAESCVLNAIVTTLFVPL